MLHSIPMFLEKNTNNFKENISVPVPVERKMQSQKEIVICSIHFFEKMLNNKQPINISNSYTARTARAPMRDRVWHHF